MRRLSLLFLAVASACGGSKPEPSAAVAPPDTPEVKAEAPDPAAEEASEEEVKKELPKECAARADDVCTPPKGFVDRLCAESNTSVALVMFAKGSPWTRGYLTRKTKAWNASGGASEAGELAFDEEVIVLRKRAEATGGMQISGAGGSFDALRWDGNCVTLAKEELTLRSPPQPKHAHIDWRWIDDDIRESLRGDDKVTKAYQARRKQCKGATMGTVSKECVKADEALSHRIVEFVRGGGKLPSPAKIP